MLLVGYAGAALGVPLPVPTVVDLSGQPFPCQGGRCGCRTAEQCWKSCCCHTNRERLAWAAAHGVTPPSYVIAAAQQDAAQSRSPRRCCAHCTKPTPAPVASATSHAPDKSVVWISAQEAARCQGSAPVWNNVPISLPAADALAAPSFELCIRPWVAVAVAAPFTPSFSPPDPPPRIR